MEVKEKHKKNWSKLKFYDNVILLGYIQYFVMQKSVYKLQQWSICIKNNRNEKEFIGIMIEYNIVTATSY